MGKTKESALQHRDATSLYPMGVLCRIMGETEESADWKKEKKTNKVQLSKPIIIIIIIIIIIMLGNELGARAPSYRLEK